MKTKTKASLLAAALFCSVTANVFAQPRISRQPDDRWVDAGSNVTFRVYVAGTNQISFQWRFNEREFDAATTNTLSAGTIANTLLLTNVQPAHSGNYTAIASDSTGSVTSRVARLEVVTPLVHSFAGITQNADGKVSLNLSGQTSMIFTQHFDIYRLECADDLTQWRVLTNLIRTNSVKDPLTFVDPDSATNPRRFYRMYTNQLITPTLPPTGPFGVGKLVRVLTDPNRTNRFNVSTNSSFPVTIWFPASIQAGELPSRFEDLPLAQHAGRWGGGYTNLVPSFVTHAVEGASLVAHPKSFPVVLYTHGGGSIRTDGQDKAENLASHGYIVLSPEHNDTYGTVFPDGRYLRGKTIAWGNQSSEAAAFADRIEDLKFLVNQLRQWNETDPVFARRLDLERMASLGGSFGGGVAAEICRIDPQVKAAVSLDGFLQGAPAALRTNSFLKPFLAIHTTYSDLTIFNKAQKEAFFFRIQDTIHENINARYWYSSSYVRAAVPGIVQKDREAADIINTYVLSFLNKYLKNVDNHLLDGPSTNFPRVINFLKK